MHTNASQLAGMHRGAHLLLEVGELEELGFSIWNLSSPAFFCGVSHQKKKPF